MNIINYMLLNISKKPSIYTIREKIFLMIHNELNIDLLEELELIFFDCKDKETLIDLKSKEYKQSKIKDIKKFNKYLTNKYCNDFLLKNHMYGTKYDEDNKILCLLKLVIFREYDYFYWYKNISIVKKYSLRNFIYLYILYILLFKKNFRLDENKSIIGSLDKNINDYLTQINYFK